MQDKRLKLSIILNIIQQVITYVLPFITVSFLTRVIGAEGIGIYSYTISIIQYSYVDVCAILNDDRINNRAVKSLITEIAEE